MGELLFNTQVGKNERRKNPRTKQSTLGRREIISEQVMGKKSLHNKLNFLKRATEFK